jgi:hypothetical protein
MTKECWCGGNKKMKKITGGMDICKRRTMDRTGTQTEEEHHFFVPTDRLTCPIQKILPTII